MNLVRIILGLLLLFFSTSTYSQWFDNVGVELRSKNGFLLPHRPVMQHLTQGHANGFELSILSQSDGSQQWQQEYNYPKNGFSFLYSNLGNKDVLGESFGLFAFGELPMFHLFGWKWNWRTGLGLSYLTKRFDQELNPKNNAIGSHLNSLVQMGVTVNRRWKHLELGLGLDATHFSNGASKTPNLGLNLPYLNIGLTYYPHLTKLKTNDDTAKFIPTSWKYRMFGVISTKQVYPTGGPNFFVSSLSFILHNHFSRKAAIEFNFDVFSNQSHRALSKNASISQLDVVQLGIFSAYVLPINRYSFLVGLGGYVKNSINPDGWIYNRFGTRYQLNEHLLLNVTIKSHWGRADYFEYGMIYTF